jgi:hypothetical protein
MKYRLRGTIGGVVAFVAYAIAPPALAFCDSTCVPRLNSTYAKEYTAVRGSKIIENGGPMVAQCDSPNDLLVGLVAWNCGTECTKTKPSSCTSTPEHIRLENNTLFLHCDYGNGANARGIVWIRCRRP